MNFNRTKYIDLIMYILSQCSYKPNFGKTVLCSILYFIDFGYYELYGELLTNETYIKSKKGIKPKHFFEVSQDLISKKQLFLRKEDYYSRRIHRYFPTIIPTPKFSQQEMEIIKLAINSLSNNNASTITKYSVHDHPMIVANFGDAIDFRYVFSINNRYSLLNKKNLFIQKT